MTQLLGALPVFRYRFAFAPEASLALPASAGSAWCRAPLRPAARRWLKARQVGPGYSLYVVWDPKAEAATRAIVGDPARPLEHAVKEVADAGYYQLPAGQIDLVAGRQRGAGGDS